MREEESSRDGAGSGGEGIIVTGFGVGESVDKVGTRT